MRTSTTARRLREELLHNKMRPIDLVNLCQPLCEKYNIKIGKNHLSQYLSGKVEPSLEKISVLAEALNVDEAYLLGYDIPRNLGQKVFLANDVKNVLLEHYSEDILDLVLKEYPILIHGFIDSHRDDIDKFLKK